MYCTFDFKGASRLPRTIATSKIKPQLACAWPGTSVGPKISSIGPILAFGA